MSLLDEDRIRRTIDRLVIRRHHIMQPVPLLRIVIPLQCRLRSHFNPNRRRFISGLFAHKSCTEMQLPWTWGPRPLDHCRLQVHRHTLSRCLESTQLRLVSWAIRRPHHGQTQTRRNCLAFNTSQRTSGANNRPTWGRTSTRSNCRQLDKPIRHRTTETDLPCALSWCWRMTGHLANLDGSMASLPTTLWRECDL